MTPLLLIFLFFITGCKCSDSVPETTPTPTPTPTLIGESPEFAKAIATLRASCEEVCKADNSETVLISEHQGFMLTCDCQHLEELKK